MVVSSVLITIISVAVSNISHLQYNKRYHTVQKMNYSDNDTQGIPLCNDNSAYPAMTAITVSLCTVAIVVNILHTAVLVTISTLRKKKHFKILLSFGVSDALISVCFVAGINGRTHDYLVSNKDYITASLLVICSHTALGFRYYVIAVASVERFYAVCLPLRRSSSMIVKNLGKVLTVMMLVSLIPCVVSCVLMYESICIDTTKGPHIEGNMQNFALIIPGFTTVILQIKIELKLRRVKQRNKDYAHYNEDLRKFTRFVRITSLLFSLILIPQFLYNAILKNIRVSYFNEINTQHMFEWCFVIADNFVYGVGMIVLYISMNPSYWKHLTLIFMQNRNGLEMRAVSSN